MRPLLPLLLVIALPLMGAEIDAPDSTISSVTVFPDRAQITRSVSVDLPAGAHTLRVAGLPPSLWPSSLRVAGESEAEVKVSAVDLRREILTAAASTRQRTLEERLDELRRSESLLKAQEQALDAQAAFIQSLGAQPATDKAAIGPQQWPAAWQAIGNGMREIGEARVKLTAEQRRLADERRAVEEELNALAQGERARYTAALNLTSNGGRATFTLTYQVPDARWAPVYDADLDSRQKTLDLVQGAYVQQQTGEDWSQVSLTLSTTRPSASSSAPELAPWWIGFPSPVEHEVADAAVAGAQAELKAYAAAPLAQRQRVAMDTVEAVVSDFAAEYRVQGKVSLAATGDRQHYRLSTSSWPVTLQLQAVPRLDLTAYLYAKLHYDGKVPLLAGEWRLSRDGAFIGSRHIRQLAPGTEEQLAFGGDDAVTLSYDLEQDEGGTAGLISRENTLTRHYRITATSGHREAMPLTILDQLPVPTNEAIKVELSRDSTAPSRTDVDEQKGVLAWDVILKPAEKVQIGFGYQIRYPGERTLDGL